MDSGSHHVILHSLYREYHFCVAAGQSWQGAAYKKTITETVTSLGARRTR